MWTINRLSTAPPDYWQFIATLASGTIMSSDLGLATVYDHKIDAIASFLSSGVIDGTAADEKILQVLSSFAAVPLPACSLKAILDGWHHSKKISDAVFKQIGKQLLDKQLQDLDQEFAAMQSPSKHPSAQATHQPVVTRLHPVFSAQSGQTSGSTQPSRTSTPTLAQAQRPTVEELQPELEKKLKVSGHAFTCQELSVDLCVFSLSYQHSARSLFHCLCT